MKRITVLCLVMAATSCGQFVQPRFDTSRGQVYMKEIYPKRYKYKVKDQYGKDSATVVITDKDVRIKTKLRNYVFNNVGELPDSVLRAPKYR